MKATRTRNFCIIAHIDHGKSTLADRLIELTGTVTDREKKDQMLDSMDIERERGITIKAAAVNLQYKALDGEIYSLNLIDTPGHVDFGYEVSRALAACEGCLLVVDASQGIEAQTLANAYQAFEADLTIIPVLNKIDLPGAEPERVTEEVCNFLGCNEDDVIPVSAKVGTNIDKVLEAIVKQIPPPKADPEAPLQALIFDSFFDSYAGAVSHLRLFNGTIRVDDQIMFMSNKKKYIVTTVGIFTPKMTPVECLEPGDVGYIAAGVKQVADTRIGDTVTLANNPASQPLPGYREAKPMVFCGLYPTDASAYGDLRDALDKLRLNDASLHYELETSDALGFGFRCGFLGLLHMEIVQERLEREYDLDLITTAPSVVFKVNMNDGTPLYLENPSKLPNSTKFQNIEEPYIKTTIIVPDDYVGPVLQLLSERRGSQKSFEYLDTKRIMLVYNLPMGEVVLDFYDKLKSMTKGYASMDYEFSHYEVSELVKVDILLNGDQVDALSFITHRTNAESRGRMIIKKMREIIPRQQYEVAIQAAIGSRVIARETVKALRKNVTAKCYGGDISRKRKLLEKQKEGKKRMKQVGTVELPQEAFMAILSTTEE